MAQPSVTPAKLLFQQCVAESSTEGNTFNFIRNEISGYLLNKAEPRALRKNVWEKTLASIKSSNRQKRQVITDPFYNNLPVVLQDLSLIHI